MKMGFKSRLSPVDPARFSDGFGFGASTAAGPVHGLKTKLPSAALRFHALNAPTQLFAAVVGRLFFAPRRALGRGTKQPLSAASTGMAEWLFWNP
jgi:hypothetical protein